MRPLHKAGPFEVWNDPQSGPFWFDLDPVDGDVTTAPMLSIADDGAGVHRVFATRRRGDPGAIPWIVQAQDVQVVDADPRDAEGASGGFAVLSRPAVERPGRRCVAAACPPTQEASHDAAGRYRVFARIAKTVPDAQAEVWVTQGDLKVPNKRVRVHRGPELDWWYYDLGLVRVDGGGGPLRGDTRTRGARPVVPQSITLHARDMDDQPGGIALDHLAFLPADTEMCWVRTRPTGVPASVVLDGLDELAYRVNADGALLPDGGTHYVGGLPRLAVKGQGTRVFMLSGVHGGAPAPLGGTALVTVEYKCWHAHVARGTFAADPDLP